MGHIKSREQVLNENKITDFFKGFNLFDIKKQLNDKFGIIEGDTKKQIANKLMDVLQHNSVKFLAKNISSVVPASLGIMLGNLISYIMSKSININTTGEMIFELAGAIFLLYRTSIGIDKYSYKGKSQLTDEVIKSEDYIKEIED